MAVQSWTLQSLIEGDMTVTAYCQNPQCARHQVLDLEKLRARLGPDTAAMADDLRPRLRCSKCGGKEIGLIYAPDTSKVTGMGRSNAYEKAKGR